MIQWLSHFNDNVICDVQFVSYRRHVCSSLPDLVRATKNTHMVRDLLEGK